MVCPACATTTQSSLPKDTHAAFVRAVLFGCGAAVLGLILYSAFGIITGLVIGYLSLAVGYLVGKAMMIGSKGIGGRRYQIVAVLLTYAAVSMSAIPIAISFQLKQRSEQSEQRRKVSGPEAQSPSAAPTDDDSAANHSQEKSTQETASESPETPRMGRAAALGDLAFIGLASPFLDLQEPIHGFIGLIILLVGIRIAWQLTAARLPEISGPFQNSPAVS